MSNRIIGNIAVTLPSGRRRVFGSPGAAGSYHSNATVELPQVAFNSYSALAACVRRGTLGFAEAYMSERVEINDLASVFRFFIDNRPALTEQGRGIFQTRRADRRYHIGRDNTRDGSRRNIAAHYDLGNPFYELWLDPGMTYSSALFLEPDATLEAAQNAKYAAVLEALDVARHSHLLEIGCGWGGFVEHAVAAGHRVNAVTISKQQLAYARARIAR
ncbi:MAG: SAM-dependent methyltransferase, partial [Hyphomicrobiaceae bacterium]